MHKLSGFNSEKLLEIMKLIVLRHRQNFIGIFWKNIHDASSEEINCIRDQDIGKILVDYSVRY